MDNNFWFMTESVECNAFHDQLLIALSRMPDYGTLRIEAQDSRKWYFIGRPWNGLCLIIETTNESLTSTEQRSTLSEMNFILLQEGSNGATRFLTLFKSCDIDKVNVISNIIEAVISNDSFPISMYGTYGIGMFSIKMDVQGPI